MKNNFRVSVFMVLFFCLFLCGLNAEQELPFVDPETTISMDFQDASLKDVLKIFSIQSGMNFIASDEVRDKKVTLYLDKVPIKDTVEKLFMANNLIYEFDEQANIILVKGSYVPKVETITKVFYLKYAAVTSSPLNREVANNIATSSASLSSSSTSSTSATTSGSSSGTSIAPVDIVTAVKNILTENGKITENTRTNSLVVTDIPSNFINIEQVISRLDIPVSSVIIEVEMLDVSKNIVDKMGFEFGEKPFTLLMPNASLKRGMRFFMGDAALRGLDQIAPATAGAVSFGNIYAQALDYLRTQTDTKYLARPRLLTLNNETAEIRIATNESIGVKTTTSSTAGTTQAEAERATTGVTLRVTPQINMETGEVTMFIYPMVAEALQGNTIQSAGANYVFRDPEERSTKSIVKVKDGETIIVGGLIRNEFTEVTTKLPILGDIPIVGALFRHRNKTKDKDRELLVFITPRIVKDANTAAAYPKKAVLPAREQSSPSIFDRQAAVNTSLNSFDKMK